jgi:hypothetical protein
MAYKRNIFVNKELIVEIRNKFQAPKTALDFISEGKEVPKWLVETAKKDLEEAVEKLEF